MITVGICDDDQKMRKILRPLLERNLQLSGVSYQIFEYASGEELAAQMDQYSLDLLFLDIEMKELNGMDTAKLLREKDHKTIIIFVTAYPDFVFQGYEVKAFHYILKPYKEQKIIDVLEAALKELAAKEEQFFTVEQKSGIMRIPIGSIRAFQSEKRKILILTEDRIIDFYGKLDDLESELPDYFIRIHNRYINNLNFVTAIEKNCCICGGTSFPVSRAYKQDLEIAFAKALLS